MKDILISFTLTVAVSFATTIGTIWVLANESKSAKFCDTKCTIVEMNTEIE